MAVIPTLQLSEACGYDQADGRDLAWCVWIFQKGTTIVELGIVKNDRHVCNGKAVRAGVVDLKERNTHDRLELTEC